MQIRKTIFILLLSTFILSAGAVDGILVAEKISPQEEILLKSRKFIPSEGIDSILVGKIKSKAPKKSYVILQLEHIPTKEEKKELEREGIKLLSYIPNKAWFASIPSERPKEIAALPNIRAIDEILPEDKISFAIKNKNYLKDEDGTVNLSVMFFKDVNLDESSSILENYGKVADKFYSVNTVKLTTEERFISEIADEETVQWIDVIDKILQLHNDSNRENIGVNTLQVSPYSLSGTGVVTAEWDGGWVDTTHDDLQGRVIIGDTGASVDNHATHVAGTMLGDGTLSQTEGGTALQWRGMAPQATVISYEWWDDSTELNNEFNSAINIYDASLFQNSWGYEYLGCGGDCSGGYDSSAAELDGIARGSKGKKITQIWSAGNSRPSDCDNGNYDCIGLPGTAKNVITVGATNSDDDSMTYFSSWGPTNDGRLKPEVTAPGCEGDRNDGTITGSVWSTLPTDTYGGYCGTSMSAPTVSGVVALILEEFANKVVYPLPSTIKAILIHTAKDLGNTGPDYSFGYGRIEALSAIDKIKEDSGTTNVIREESVSQSEYDEFDMTVPESQSSLKVTLVWDDYPAAANADLALVNNLNLVLTAPDSSLYYPWVLDPANPGNSATTGTNTLDNVEQIYITTPSAGIWKVKVTGTAVPNGPQDYSLVSDFSFGIKPEVEVKTFRDSSYSQEDRFLDLGQTVYIQANVTAGGSPITGATVTADLILSNETTEDSLTLNEIGNGIYRNSWDSSSHTVDAYSIKVSVSGPITGEDEGGFHLYSGSGVSAYQLDWDNDASKDFVLENKHLISVFDGKADTDKSLLYLYQKDTDIRYNFAEISDSNSKGTGEVTTTNLKDLRFYSFLFSQTGENLSTVDLDITAEASDPTEQLITYYDLSNGASYDGNYFIDNGQWIGERFDPADLDTAYTLTKISVYVDKGTKASNPLIIEIRTDSGGSPSNTVLTSESIPASSVPVSSGWVDTTLTNQINLEQGSLYWLVLRNIDSQAGSNYAYTWTGDDTSPSYPGAMVFSQDQGSSWTDGSASYDMIFRVYGYPAAITTTFDLSIQMKSQDVDYLVYKLSNFDEYIDDIFDIFSPISGVLGSSIIDDRYHFGDGTDGFVNSLTPNTWTNFSTTTDQQRYVAVYDTENVISWIYFPNASSTDFQDVGLWYETGKEGLRIRYDTTSATSTNEAEYILSFTKGDWSTIDYWMSTIASGQFPDPNFMTTEVLTTLTRSDFPADLWQMISVPLEPENPDPEVILSDDLGGIFYNWTLARWQPFEGVYKYHKAVCCPWATSSTSILPNFSPGLGYWLITRLGPTDIDASGDLTPDNDYYIHLSSGTSTETGGWNQIGVPFNYSVDWSSSTIRVKNTQTQEIVDIDTAQDEEHRWMENKIWWQVGTSTEYSFAIAPEGQLDPWQGYWVHNFIECDLIISPTPVEGASAQSASISSFTQEKQGKEKRQKKPGRYLPEWKLQFSISAGSKKDTYNFAGISPVAKDDYDALDVLEPPQISKGINLYFPEQDWSFNPGNYTQDIRKSEFKNKEWNFEIKSELQQTAITLKWLGLEQVRYYDLSLIELDTNQTIEIYSTTDYTFELEKGGIRQFKLTVELKPGRGRISNRVDK